MSLGNRYIMLYQTCDATCNKPYIESVGVINIRLSLTVICQNNGSRLNCDSYVFGPGRRIFPTDVPSQIFKLISN